MKSVHKDSTLKRDYLPANGWRSHQQALDDGVPVFAFIVHNLDVVQIGIGPVHEPADEVQRDAVGEYNLTVHELGSVLAVHVAALHLRDLAVVCEEHLPVETKGWLRMNRSAELENTLFSSHLALL